MPCSILSKNYSLNEIILSVDKGKTVAHKYYIENCPKPFVNEIWKQTETSGSKMYKIA
jgi:hypothetical protein